MSGKRGKRGKRGKGENEERGKRGKPVIVNYYNNYNIVLDRIVSETEHPESVPDRASVHTGTRGGGALPYKAIQDMPFFRVSFVIINS